MMSKYFKLSSSSNQVYHTIEYNYKSFPLFRYLKCLSDSGADAACTGLCSEKQRHYMINKLSHMIKCTIEEDVNLCRTALTYGCLHGKITPILISCQ